MSPRAKTVVAWLEADAASTVARARAEAPPRCADNFLQVAHLYGLVVLLLPQVMMNLGRSGWPRRGVGSPACLPERAMIHSVGVNGTSVASCGTRRGAGARCGELVALRILSRPMFGRVRCARAGLGCAGQAPPARLPPLPPSGGRVPIGGAPAHGRSRSPHRRHGVKLATSTTPRVPEMVQVATGPSPLRGFPRIGGASRMPTIPVAPL